MGFGYEGGNDEPGGSGPGELPLLGFTTDVGISRDSRLGNTSE